MAQRDNILAIGIDLGGTDIKGGLIDARGNVLKKLSVATEAEHGPPAVISRIVELIRSLASGAERGGALIAGVGLGMPGSIRARAGLVVNPPNLPGWREVQVVEPVSQATQLPVMLENDANAAVLGEYWCGAGRGTEDMAMFTLGTGIGGGIIVGGRLWRGRFENAGELGHQIIVPDGRLCKCGQRGCLEAYASAATTAARATEHVGNGDATVLKNWLARDGRLTSQHIVQGVLEGDAIATEVWDTTCRFLALACVNLQHALNFERIILAGGMSAAGPTLLDRVRHHFQQLMWPDIGDRPEILLAELGNDAGFIGAAFLALK